EDLSETFYEGICQLPAAHYMIVDVNSISFQVKRYWSLSKDQINEKIGLDEAGERFYQLLTTSVKRRLRSDVAIGSSLSGGMDSSIIVALIDQLNKGRVHVQTTFSAVFPGFYKDEQKYIEEVVQGIRAESYYTTPSAETLLNDLDECFYFQE